MIGELGHLALILAFLVAVSQGVVPLLGAWRRIPAGMAVAIPAARAHFLLVGTSHLCLTHAFVVSDFSFAYVAQNSNTALPLIYKISAVWGAHEGSMLLWATILAGWGFAKVLRDGEAVAVLHPDKRTCINQAEPMTEEAIDPGFTHDFYVALGEPAGAEDAWTMRVQYKPLVRWIWLGPLMMAIGGLLAASDRRYRQSPRPVRAAAVAGGAQAYG